MIKLICVGKNKDKNLEALNREYLKRMQAFDKMLIEEVKDEPDVHSQRENEARAIKDKEGARVLAKIKDSDFVVLLDLHGMMMDSIAFSKERQKWAARGSLVFVIAGSLGPSEDLLKRANARWKLSDLTFTHLMCRTLVLEQIYRSFMIEHNRSYHK